VIVTFNFNKLGKIDYIAVKRSISVGCDGEAVRVIGAMPDRYLALHKNGNHVKVTYTLPVPFKPVTK
jgi:periplasmic protein TonB